MKVIITYKAWSRFYKTKVMSFRDRDEMNEHLDKMEQGFNKIIGIRIIE